MCFSNYCRIVTQWAEKYNPRISLSLAMASQDFVSSSLLTKFPSPIMSRNSFGLQGNSSPSGSSETRERPLLVNTSPVFASRMMSVGIPLTRNFWDSWSCERGHFKCGHYVLLAKCVCVRVCVCIYIYVCVCVYISEVIDLNCISHQLHFYKAYIISQTSIKRWAPSLAVG